MNKCFSVFWIKSEITCKYMILQVLNTYVTSEVDVSMHRRNFAKVGMIFVMYKLCLVLLRTLF